MYNRSFHFIPSHRKEFFRKLNHLSADHFVIDLEDGVPETLLDIGKKNILEFANNCKNKNIWIRVHNEESEYFNDDLQFVEKFPNWGIIIPKFKPKSWEKYILFKKKIILIESLMDLNQILLFSNELKKMDLFAIGLGLEDMLTGFYQNNESLKNLINHIRANFISINKSICNILLDGVFTNYKDNELFYEDCKKSLSYGYSGRFSIHPNQISIINNIYNINEDDYKYAQKIISLSKQKDYPGYSIIDGMLLTPPKIEKSKTILSKGLNDE